MSDKRREQNSETVSNQIYTFACTTCFASSSFASRMKAVVVAMLAYVNGIPFPYLKFPLGITSSPSPPLPHRLKRKKKKKKKKKLKLCQLTLDHCADGLEREVEGGPIETSATVQPTNHSHG